MQRTVKFVGFTAFVVILAFFASLGSKPAEDQSTPAQTKNALVQGEWQEQGVQDPQDPIADLWSPDLFSQPREIESGCWTRSNYGLCRIERCAGRRYLELSPNGSLSVWETFGELTTNTRQAVVAAGSPLLAKILPEGSAMWGTLAVHLSGSNADDAEVVAVTFIPNGTPQRLTLAPETE
jgi:hypothetical protein